MAMLGLAGLGVEKSERSFKSAGQSHFKHRSIGSVPCSDVQATKMDRQGPSSFSHLVLKIKRFGLNFT